MLAKHALYQLSYGPLSEPSQESLVAIRHLISGSRSEGVVGPGRLELPTSRLSGVRSNQAELRAYGSETPGSWRTASPLGSRSRRLTFTAGGEWKEKRRRRYPAYF